MTATATVNEICQRHGLLVRWYPVFHSQRLYVSKPDGAWVDTTIAITDDGDICTDVALVQYWRELRRLRSIAAKSRKEYKNVKACIVELFQTLSRLQEEGVR